MTTNEFMQQIEWLGFSVKKLNGDDNTFLGIGAPCETWYYAVVSPTSDYLHLDINEITVLHKKWRDELVIICMDYASTPIEERKDEKKYHWKIKCKNYDDNFSGHLNKHTGTNKWLIDSKREVPTFRTRFTEKEYKKMVEDSFIPDIFEKEEI